MGVVRQDLASRRLSLLRHDSVVQCSMWVWLGAIPLAIWVVVGPGKSFVSGGERSWVVMPV